MSDKKDDGSPRNDELANKLRAALGRVDKGRGHMEHLSLRAGETPAETIEAVRLAIGTILDDLKAAGAMATAFTFAVASRVVDDGGEVSNELKLTGTGMANSANPVDVVGMAVQQVRQAIPALCFKIIREAGGGPREFLRAVKEAHRLQGRAMEELAAATGVPEHFASLLTTMGIILATPGGCGDPDCKSCDGEPRFDPKKGEDDDGGGFGKLLGFDPFRKPPKKPPVM